MPKTLYSRGLPGLFASVILLILSGVALKEIRLGTASQATNKPMEAVVNSLQFADNKHRLRTDYTGIASVDFGLRYLVAAFLPAAAGWDKGFQIQQIYFLVSFFPIVALWSVEAGRRRNAWAWTSFTSIWAIFYQTVGGAVIVPLYYLAYMRESATIDYWSPASRQVPVSYAKALLPATVGGYLIPTISMYLPFKDADLNITQGLIAFWQFSPLFVNILLFNPTTLWKGPAPSESATSQPRDDVKYLNRVYLTCFAVSAITHIGTMFMCLSSTDPETSFARAIFPLPVSVQMSMTDALHYIFQVDFWIIFTSALIGAYITLWDLKRAGKTNLSLIKAAAGMAVAVVGVGPAATISGVWYIREEIMARKDKE